MVCENWFMWSWSFIFQSSHSTCLKQNLSALQEDDDSSLLWGWLEVRGQLLFSRGKSRVLLAPFTLTFYLLLEPVSHLTTLLSQNFCYVLCLVAQNVCWEKICVCESVWLLLWKKCYVQALSACFLQRFGQGPSCLIWHNFTWAGCVQSNFWCRDAGNIILC